MKNEYVNCPFCKQIVEVDISWAIKNERIFCGSCCKAFPIRVGEEEKEEPPPIPKDITIEEKWDNGIKEILYEDDDETWDGPYLWDEF